MHQPEQMHLGAYCELIAANWLMARGWLVFRNVSSHGIADLMVLHPPTGEKRIYDVKCWRGVAGSVLTERQRELGILILYVHPETQRVTEGIEEARREAAMVKVLAL